MKLVINKEYGGFDLSDEACEMLDCNRYDYDYNRTDEKLIAVVEKLGARASTQYSRLVVVEIPDEATDYDIREYDGYESVIYVLDGKIRSEYE